MLVRMHDCGARLERLYSGNNLDPDGRTFARSVPYAEGASVLAEIGHVRGASRTRSLIDQFGGSDQAKPESPAPFVFHRVVFPTGRERVKRILSLILPLYLAKLGSRLRSTKMDIRNDRRNLRAPLAGLDFKPAAELFQSFFHPHDSDTGTLA